MTTATFRESFLDQVASASLLVVAGLMVLAQIVLMLL